MNPGELFDSFPEDKQNMSKAEFIRECNRLTDPRRMKSDLNQILQGKREKQIIDRAVKR